MRDLYILRHGAAVPPGTPGIQDDDRPLTDKGEKEIRKLGKGLKRLKLELERIVTSPLPRAHRTAELVAKKLGLLDRLEVADELRSGRSATAIQEWLASRPESSMLIVGHNPEFSELIERLAVGYEPDRSFCELVKGGLAAFHSVDGYQYQLEWLVTPQLVRRLRCS